MNPEQPLSSCFVAGFSMEPLLHSGDRVILRPVEHHAVVPGDLIVFSQGGRRIVHRVIRTENGILTQGDANPMPDEPLEEGTPLWRCLSVERDGMQIPLQNGASGLEQFRHHQRLRKWRERVLKTARLFCRISPFKLRADALEQSVFGSLRVFYWRKRPVACEQDGEWRWMKPGYAFFIKRAHRRTLREKERKEMEFDRILFRLLGEIAFGDPRKYFSALPAEMQDELCRKGRMQALSPIFYYSLTDRLPSNLFPVFKQDFYVQSQYDFFYSSALREAGQEFAECGAEFIPLKGSYFAYEVYPHPALRFRRDQDILFRRTEIERVFHHLEQKGWSAGEKRHPFFKRLHLPTLIKTGRPALELHWHILKNRSFFDPEMLWDSSLAVEGSEFRRNLPPEAHYLLTVYNLYFDRFQFACRSLLDLAFLQKAFPLDREKISDWNRKWKLNLDLGLCYRLFPDMFPEEQRLFPPQTEVSERVRLAVSRLSLMEYPEAVVPFLSRCGGPLPEVPAKRKKRGLFRRSRTADRGKEHLLRLLSRDLPQVMELKQRYRREKNS